MAERFTRGGRLYCMGNGGSARDAQHVAVEFFHPIIEKRRPLPALALAADKALVTAISNDRDFAKVFADQLRVLGRPGDMALGISTSGHSPNLDPGAARPPATLGLLTIAFAGKDGGRSSSWPTTASSSRRSASTASRRPMWRCSTSSGISCTSPSGEDDVI